MPDALIAEPGFSALVRLRKGERERTLLFDTGVSPGGMVENMRRLGISPEDIEVIVLSHGHWDHVTGMEGLVAYARAHAAAGDDPPRVLEPATHPVSGSRTGGAARDQPLARSRAWALRSSRNASRRSCSTALLW